MNTLAKGWFSELSLEDRPQFQEPEKPVKTEYYWREGDRTAVDGSWPGQAFSLKVNKILYNQKSLFQDILVFQSTTYGNVLVLDGAVQCTERDEFSYQEMLTHLPLFAHDNPTNVCIIGGGDGGVLREVLKHDTVESVTLCEIDKEVVEVSKKYLPEMAKAFTSPKLNLHIGDGHQFLTENKAKFDVIITDSSDPVGPAESLFGESYYNLVKESLTDKGVLSSQGEVFWLDLNLIVEMQQFCRTIFPTVGYAAANVSTYTGGVMGYLVCSKDPKNKMNVPKRMLTDEKIKRMNLRYYNSAVHRAAFVLPQFVKKAIQNATS